jgi:shikimate kinase
MKRHLALVGFMASGKSTIGRKLARRLGCSFVDTDAVVAGEHGPIAEVFAREGEAAFRRYEHAASGGALTVAANRKLLADRAYCVFIRVSPEQVLERVRKSKERRPVLGDAPTLAKIKDLYERRMPQYESADHMVQADRLRSQEVLDDIVAWLGRRQIQLGH